MVGIYKVESPNGEIYLGQSRHVIKRWGSLKRTTCPRPELLVKSILRYGQSVHIFSVAHELPDDISQNILDLYEQIYIKQYKDCGVSLLNIQNGGYRSRHVDSTKEKLKLRKCSDETKRKISIAHKGKVLSTEHRLKLSVSHKGFVASTEQLEKARQANLKPVVQYSKHNEFIKEWPSIKEASISLGVNRGSIWACLYGKGKLGGGFAWKFKT